MIWFGLLETGAPQGSKRGMVEGPSSTRLEIIHTLNCHGWMLVETDLEDEVTAGEQVLE